MDTITRPPAPSPSPASAGEGACPVAATMRRVHDQLRQGAAPSFETLVALGGAGRA